MNKIILVNTSCVLVPGDGSILLKQLPYGVAVVNAVLKQNGFDSKLVDLALKVKYYEGDITNDCFHKWLVNNVKDEKINEYLIKCISELNLSNETQIIGFSVPYERIYNYALALAKEIKSLYPEINICLGGTYIPYIKDFPSYIDYVIKGCGGPPMVHLCNYLLNKNHVDINFEGLSYRDGNGIFINKGSHFENAEEELLPDYSDLNIKDYVINIKNLGLNKINFSDFIAVSYRTHRGCAGACSFCGVNLDHKLAKKSPEKAFRELYILSKLYPNVYIQFNDSAINNFMGDFSKLLDLIINSDLNISFFAFIKMKGIDDEFLKKLSKAGCNRLYWGVEHFSPRMIKLFNKHDDLSRIDHILKTSTDLGMLNEISLIINAPGETMKDVKIMKKKFISLLRFDNLTIRLLTYFNDPFSPMARFPHKFNFQAYNKETDNAIIEKIGWKPTNMSTSDFIKKYKKTEKIQGELVRFKNFVVKARQKRLNLPISVLRLLFFIKDSLRKPYSLPTN